MNRSVQAGAWSVATRVLPLASRIICRYSPIDDDARTLGKRSATLREAGWYRTLKSRRGHDLASNDYLGLASWVRLRRTGSAALDRGVGIGSGGSRLLRGNAKEHEQLEEEAARLGAEPALFMGSAYGANVLIVATLPPRGDLVVYDELVYASVNEGLRRGRADRTAFS